MHLLITTCCFVHVCNLLPLDTQCQYDAIMPLEGFLTLIGGAGVPYLRGRGRMDLHTGKIILKKPQLEINSFHLCLCASLSLFQFMSSIRCLVKLDELYKQKDESTIPDFQHKTRLWAEVIRISQEVCG